MSIAYNLPDPPVLSLMSALVVTTICCLLPLRFRIIRITHHEQQTTRKTKKQNHKTKREELIIALLETEKSKIGPTHNRMQDQQLAQLHQTTCGDGQERTPELSLPSTSDGTLCHNMSGPNVEISVA